MLRVGLLGSGPWASTVHAPTFAAGPETCLAGVWSRTPERARVLAAAHGVPAFDDVDALLDACDAVVCAVPPTVQPALAVAASFEATGGRACFLSGAFLGGPYHASGWRSSLGALLDVGPHVLDLVDAALGRVVSVRASGRDWVSLVCEHETGAVSDVAVSCSVAITPSRTEVVLFGRRGTLAVDARSGDRDVWFARMRQRFAAVAAAGGAPHDLDVHRGLHLQRVIFRASGGTGRP